MPYLLLILALPLLYAAIRALGLFVRDLLVNPVSAVLSLVMAVGFFVAISYGLILAMGLMGVGAVGERGEWSQMWPVATTAGAGLLVGNLAYWGKVRWLDYLAARRWARRERQAARIARRGRV